MLFGKFSYSRKIGTSGIPRNCSRWGSCRNPPTTGAHSKMAKLENGIIRSGDSGKYFLQSDDYGEYFSENSSKGVKSEHRKSLVIVACGDFAEIRPLLAITQNGET